MLGASTTYTGTAVAPNVLSRIRTGSELPGIGSCAVTRTFVHCCSPGRYPGSTTRTSRPIRCSASGRAPPISPKPPVLTRGCASLVANSTLCIDWITWKSTRRPALLLLHLFCRAHVSGYNSLSRRAYDAELPTQLANVALPMALSLLQEL